MEAWHSDLSQMRILHIVSYCKMSILPLITAALGRQRQVDLCESETSLTYIMNSRRARDIYWDPGSKKKKSPCFWIGRTNIVKMTILLKLICRFNAAPFKLQIYFTGLGEKQEFIWNPKRPQKAKEIPRSKSSAGGITIPALKFPVGLYSLVLA